MACPCADKPMTREEHEEAKAMDKLMEREYPQDSHRAMRVPLFFTNHEVEQEWICRKYGHKSWQYNLLLRLHSNPVQITLGVLLFIDVIVLVVELVLAAEFPLAAVVERNCECVPHGSENEGESHELLLRFLAQNNGTGEGICYPEAKELPGALEAAEVALFAMSIAILLVFELEFLLLFILLRDKFFRNILYLIDFLIVSISLGLEIAIEVANLEEVGEEAEVDQAQTEGILAVLLFVRIWRFVRIGHAIYNDASELGSHKIRKLKLEKMRLAEQLAQANRMLENFNKNNSSMTLNSATIDETKGDAVHVDISRT